MSPFGAPHMRPNGGERTAALVGLLMNAERRSCGRQCRVLAAIGMLGGALVLPRPVHAAHTIVVEPAVVRTWDEIVSGSAGRRSGERQGASPRGAPLVAGTLTPPGLGASATEAAGTALDTQIGRVAATAQGLIVSAAFQALLDNQEVFPPDTMGAVGPRHLVTMLNSQVRIQDKGGGIISTVSLEDFWAPVVVGILFDPMVVYDVLSGRWIAIVSDGDPVLMAVSADDDPTGSWSFYAIDVSAANTAFADFPKLGVNATWIAITANMIPAPGLTGAGAELVVVDKSTALAGGPLTVTIFEPGFDVFDYGAFFNIVGAFVFPALTLNPSEPKLYLVTNPGLLAGATPLLRLSEITGTGPAPVWSPTAGSQFGATGLFPVTIPFNFSQINAPQRHLPSTCKGGPDNGLPCPFSCAPPGQCRGLETGFARLSAPVVRDGQLWVTHSAGLPADTNPPDRAAIFWYQIDLSSMASTGAPVVQSGVIEEGPGTHLFYPSIAVNQNADVCIGFSRSDATRFAEAVVTSRLGTDPPGTMAPLSVLKEGEGAYFETLGFGRNRWGDYSATAVDPEDDLAFWTIQEYAVSDTRWGTWWGRLSSCGDGVVQPGEACDDGAANGSTCCSTTCQLPDVDGDGVCDHADPCPHVNGASPQPLMGSLGVTLRYRASGPGSLDDSLSVAAAFATAASFDLDSTDTLHVRLDSTVSARTLFETHLAPGVTWLQPNPTERRWLYRNRNHPPPMGVRKAEIRETGPGSGLYKAKLAGREASINDPPAPLAPGEGVHIIIEVGAGSAGECFAASLASCHSVGPNSQRCE